MGDGVLRPRTLWRQGGSWTAVCTLWAGGAAVAQSTSEAPRVAAIEVRADVAVSEDELRRLVVIAVGDPVDPGTLRATLRNLHASGRFDEAEAWVSLRGDDDSGAPARATVVLVLRGAVRVESVGIEGDLGVARDVLSAAVDQKAGQPLVEDRILRSERQIEETLRSRGFLLGQARVRVVVDEEQKTARVVFAVEAGERATVGEITVDGDLGGLTAAELLSALELETGDRFSEEATRDAAERLRRWLMRQGRAQSEVEIPRSQADPDSPLVVDLAFAVDVGPRFEFTLRGGDRKKLERQGLFPFLGEEGYDEALVLQSLDRLRSHFQELGHYDVSIERQEENTADGVHLTLAITPGPLYELSSVVLAGNDSFADERLERLMTTGPRRAFQPGSGRLVDEVLEDDVANLRSFYALEGFGRARIGPPGIERHGSALSVAIPIREGPRATLESFTLEGADSLAQELGGLDKLLALLPLEPGGPFHPLRLQGALDALRAIYQDRGYDGTQVSPTVVWNEERTIAQVTVRVLEGPALVIDRVVLRGNQHTRPEVLRSWVALEPGGRVSSRQLLEVQRRLYGLGVFSRVEVELKRSGDHPGERDLLVRVEEGKRHRVSYSLGYDSEDGVRGLVGYSQQNLWGRAASFQVDARASQRTEQFRVLLVQPVAGRLQGQTAGSIFRLEEERESFNSKQLGALLQVDRLWRDVRAGLSLGYRLVELDLAPGVPIDDDEITRDQREAQIASLTPSLVVDRRDDPIEPGRGWTLAVQAEQAFPLASAQEEFTKLFVQGTGVLPLGRLGVLAGSVRLGGIEPQDDGVAPDPLVPADLPSAQIPISERFFGGGRTTHRAYGRDLLGMRGETLCRARVERDAVAPCRPDTDGGDVFFPVGGNGLGLVNVDLRFPIAGPVGGVLFVDGGNVWSDWRSIDFSQAKWGAGVGVRYLSPIGPLRAEIGWKLDREPGENAYEVRISFGNPF